MHANLLEAEPALESMQNIKKKRTHINTISLLWELN